MQTKIYGFTIIELLIAFAIVAAIAAAAIPVYSNYYLKFKVSDMYTLAQNAQMYVVDDYRNNTAIANINYPANSAPFVTVNQVYIASLAITAGVITIMGNASYLGGHNISLTLTPTINTNNTDLNWECTVNNAQYYDLVPQACKQTS
jgi:prepilin-type N-terminal cleavage/methylation domain-containing protein